MLGTFKPFLAAGIRFGSNLLALLSDERRPSPLAAERVPCCNFCETPSDRMEDFSGRPRARCPSCGSLERHRAFLDAYSRMIEREFDFRGKRVLHIAPSTPVRDFLKARADLVTADVRPIGCDLTVDICHMPQVEANSFDAIIAKAVLQHCYDDEAALDEFRRILRPSGRVFLHLSCRLNSENTAAIDRTAHYDQQSVDRYRVGTYRYYGDLGALRQLQSRFIVKTFHGTDPISGEVEVFFCGIKDSQES